jgi:hypothetical protein
MNFMLNLAYEKINMVSEQVLKMTICTLKKKEGSHGRLRVAKPLPLV